MIPPTEPLPDLSGITLESLIADSSHPVLAGCAQLLLARAGVPAYAAYEDGPYQL